MKANSDRYEIMQYRKLGKSGLKLPILTLGLWNNFGEFDDFDKCEEIVWEAFNNGITHFDLANNYGPPPGSAETNFGKILKNGLDKYRDEIIISTKAGYDMWDGPYQVGGSRKYLMSSLDQSLERMGLKYVDIFYHHVPDPETDMYETALALRDIVLQGKALYVGLSNYNSEQLKEMSKHMDDLKVPYVITQPSYSMINRWIEKDNLLTTQDLIGGGTICFSVLGQGLLSNKYIDGIPEDSRAKNDRIIFLNENNIDENLISLLKKLEVIASKRNQTISELALCYVLDDPRVTSALMGVRTIEQLQTNLNTLKNLELSESEMIEIRSALDEYEGNLTK